MSCLVHARLASSCSTWLLLFVALLTIVPQSDTKLHRIFRFRMGTHGLPIEVARHLGLPCSCRVCHVRRFGALCDERHVLLECPALSGIRAAFPGLIAEFSGVMAKLVWAKDQPLVCRYMIACLDRAEAC